MFMKYILFSIFSLHLLFGQLVVLHYKGKVFWAKNNQEKLLLKRLDTVWHYGTIIFEDDSGYIALYDVKRKKALELNSTKKRYYEVKSLLNSNENSLYSAGRYVLSYSFYYYSARNSGVTLGAVTRGLSFVNIITPNKNLFYRDSIVIQYHKYKSAKYYEINLLDYNGNLLKRFITQDTFLHIKYDSLLSEVYYYYEVHPINKVNERFVISQYKQSFFVVSRDKELDLMNKEREIIDLYKKNRSFKYFYNLVSFYYENNMYNKMIDLLNKHQYSLYVSSNNDLLLVKNVISCLDYNDPIILHNGDNNVYFYIVKGNFMILCNWCDYYNILFSLSYNNDNPKYNLLIVIENDKYIDIIEHYIEVMS